MRAWSSWKNRSGRDRCYRIIFKSPGTGSGYPDCVLISFCRILQLVESSLLYHRELGGAFVWLCLLVAVGFYSVKPPGCFMWMCFIYTPHYRNPGPLTQLLPFRSVFRKKKKTTEKWETKCIALHLLSFTCTIILVQIRCEMLPSRREAFFVVVSIRCRVGTS